MVSLPRSPKSYIQPTDQTRVELLWNGTYSVLSSAGFSSQNLGIAYPGSNIPKYWNEYFGIYKYAVIEKVSIRFEVANIGGRPMRIVMAESNTLDVVPTTYLELAETPRSKTRTLIPAGNHSVVTLNHTTTASAIMGHKIEDDEAYWCTQTGVPAAPVQPLVVLAFEPILPASTIDFTYQVHIKYDLKFFTLNHL